ncbi:hypothetical protein HME9302_01840 [Alteripontixanthobacter maritimus]|uniref:Uncharacterized protein n=1 Tax=Alteripontixanthobacter maritimus TaxID=2161824 RepID=A0A369QBL1_9SPHN|nr:TonB family protein [Alteripontixanthobacter maritimus]RDC60626.1 hypothetical protein HME9302_01840 [Alteripontixanthobacter maritimus]
MAREGSYSTIRQKPRPLTITAIILLHILAMYGLAKAFAPEMTGSVERSVVSAFTVNITAPEEEVPPPPEVEPEPDEGAQGDPGREAVAKPVAAPEPKVVIKPSKPMPKATSTGTADTSGAADQGSGTGAAGTGLGTGGGQGGDGAGNARPPVAVTKPQHISGGIDNVRDYPIPEGGRQARRGNKVTVKVTVGVDGRASNCSIFRASPDPEADRLTCQLVVDRLRFKPASDSNGNPIAAPFYWQQRWF